MTTTATANETSTTTITGKMVNGKLQLRIPKRDMDKLRQVKGLCQALAEFPRLSDVSMQVAANLGNIIDELESSE